MDKNPYPMSPASLCTLLLQPADWDVILDFCFDLDVDVDLPLVIRDMATRYSSQHAAELSRHTRSILKCRTNANYATELEKARASDGEDITQFCANLENVLTDPGSILRLREARAQQVANYYSGR